MSQKLIVKIVLGFLLGIVGILVFSIGSCEYKRRSMEHAFDKIEVGDTRQAVLELMGEPAAGDVETCKPSEDCRDRYLYYSFMNRWIVYFDKNDRVNFRVHNAGSF